MYRQANRDAGGMKRITADCFVHVAGRYHECEYLVEILIYSKDLPIEIYMGVRYLYASERAEVQWPEKIASGIIDE
jgi:hypothetical protein